MRDTRTNTRAHARAQTCANIQARIRTIIVKHMRTRAIMRDTRTNTRAHARAQTCANIQARIRTIIVKHMHTIDLIGLKRVYIHRRQLLYL